MKGLNTAVCSDEPLSPLGLMWKSSEEDGMFHTVALLCKGIELREVHHWDICQLTIMFVNCLESQTFGDGLAEGERDGCVVGVDNGMADAKPFIPTDPGKQFNERRCPSCICSPP